MSETALDRLPRIHDLPVDERPRERLRLRGAAALSDAELLAILLRTGSKGENVVALAGRILAGFNGLSGLGQTSFTELRQVKGIGDAKAAQVLAGMVLGQRSVTTRISQAPTIRSCEDIF